MKTTIELPDTLLAQVRRYADARNMTMKAVVELGLRQVLSEKKTQPAFRLRKASFKGNGLQKEFQAAGWDAIRAAAYENHGA